MVVDDLEQENKKLNKRIQTLEADIEYYKEEMKKMSIESTSVRARNENNINENVIDIKKHSAAYTKFKDLFDD